MNGAAPDWLLAVQDRAGPLLPAAQRLLQQHACLDLPPDAHGLARLCKWLCEWREQGTDPAAEFRLVEGAGALLACILLHHYPQARHAARDETHRLRIGKYGFFDPFAAIERVLQAADHRAALADELAQAEAEAGDRGSLSRVVGELLRQLAEARPDLRLSDQFEYELQFGPDIRVDLRRVVEATRDASPEDVAHSVRRLVAALVDGERGALSWADVEPRLMPRLVGDHFTRSIAGSGGALETLLIEPWAGELRVAYVLRYQGRARYARRGELAEWRCSLADVHQTALRNLERCSERTRWQRVTSLHGTVLEACTGDGLDAARVLLPSLYDQLADRLLRGAQGALQSKLLVGVPHRDSLLACAAGDAASSLQFAAHVKQQAMRAPHRISERMWVLAPGGALLPGP